MEVQERNGVRIYSLTSGTALPPWLGERARRNLSKRDPSLRRRVELLQDFDMPSSSSKVRQSPDGRYLLALGTYKPRVRCYDVDQLGMKFERYLDAEAVDVTFLGEDYGKFAVLLSDRSVSFHAPYGSHDVIRIPSFGRALGYEWSTCDLFVPSSSGETYRFNLELGKFQQSLGGADGNKVESKGGGTCIAMSPTHRLAAVGHEDGLLRFYDARTPSKKPLVRLDVAAATANHGFHGEDDGGYGGRIPGELSSVSFDPSGMYLACGTRGGCVPLYDVRSPRPLHVKEHQYGLPVHSVQFHRSRVGGGGGSGGNCVMSADAKLVKIWSMDASYSANEDRHDDGDLGIIGANDNASGGSVGRIVANIEGSADIAHFTVAGDEVDPSGSRSGLVLCASESPRMQAFYCPVLGAAPRWCSFLDSITEELEEGDLNDPSSTDPAKTSESAASSSVYQDFKFVTRDELETLGVSNLIGTPLLRGYMHGFFMDTALYSKVRAVAKPFEYEEYRKDKVRKKIEERRSSRIAPRKSDRKKDKPTVNAELAARLRDKAGGGDEDDGDGKRKKKGSAAEKAVARTVLADDRFSSLFDDPDYQIDEEDENFRLRHASGFSKKAKNGTDDEDDDSEDMDSDRDEDDNWSGGNGEAAFDRVTNEAGEPDEDELASDDSDDSHGDDSGDSDEDDGFAGARVRGENYAATRGSNENKGRKGRSADSATIFGRDEKRKSKGDRGKVRAKHVLYEADDYDDGDDRNAVLGIGLGMPGAHLDAKRRKNEASMPLEERIRLRVEEEKGSSRLDGRGQTDDGEYAFREKGSSRHITYIPKDSKKKKTELEGEGRGSRGAKRRHRRSIKDLGRK